MGSFPPGVTIPLTKDAFLGGILTIHQPERGYRAGLDAVLLAVSAPLTSGAGNRVLDAGAGVGVVGLAIAARVSDASVVLVENNPAMVTLAMRNITENRLQDRVTVVNADIARGGAVLHALDRPAQLAPATFTHLVCNPPYNSAGAGTEPSSAGHAAAHQMPHEALARWAAFLATAGMADASLTLIHRADALDRVLTALAGRFGAIRIRPVHAKAQDPARRILVHAIKGSRAPLELLPPLVLQEADGRYRAEIEAALRTGSTI